MTITEKYFLLILEKSFSTSRYLCVPNDMRAIFVMQINSNLNIYRLSIVIYAKRETHRSLEIPSPHDRSFAELAGWMTMIDLRFEWLSEFLTIHKVTLCLPKGTTRWCIRRRVITRSTILRKALSPKWMIVFRRSKMKVKRPKEIPRAGNTPVKDKFIHR